MLLAIGSYLQDDGVCSLQIYFHELQVRFPPSLTWQRRTEGKWLSGQCISGLSCFWRCAGIRSSLRWRSDRILALPLHPKLLWPLCLPLGFHSEKRNFLDAKDKLSLRYPHLGIFKAKCRRFYQNSICISCSSWCLCVCTPVHLCGLVCTGTCTNVLLLYRLWLMIFTCWNYWYYLTWWSNLSLSTCLPQYK